MGVKASAQLGAARLRPATSRWAPLLCLTLGAFERRAGVVADVDLRAGWVNPDDSRLLRPARSAEGVVLEDHLRPAAGEGDGRRADVLAQREDVVADDHRPV